MFNPFLVFSSQPKLREIPRKLEARKVTSNSLPQWIHKQPSRMAPKVIDLSIHISPICKICGVIRHILEVIYHLRKLTFINIMSIMYMFFYICLTLYITCALLTSMFAQSQKQVRKGCKCHFASFHNYFIYFELQRLCSSRFFASFQPPTEMCKKTGSPSERWDR